MYISDEFRLETNWYMPPAQIPVILYLGTEGSQDKIRKRINYIEKHLGCSVEHVTNISELIRSVTALLRIDFIGIDAEAIDSEYDIVELVRTIKFILTLRKLPISAGVGVIIDHQTPKNIVKNLIRAPQIDCIPYRYTLTDQFNLAVEQSRRLLNRDYSMSKETQNVINLYKSCRQKRSVDELTPRQTQILNLIQRRGLSNKQIARVMNVSESAVKSHITALFKKFNVHSRAQLIAFQPKK